MDHCPTTTTSATHAPQLDDSSLDLLFRQARSFNRWQATPVSDEQLQQLYALLKMGPTSMNCSPARFTFVRSEAGKAQLASAVFPNNADKVRAAPVVAIIAQDQAFHTHMGELFPHMDVAPLFAGNQDLAHSTASRNAVLQGAYLMLAARGMGLDCGPMSGFDNNAVDQHFFADTELRSNFLCCLGYGERNALQPRLPRLSFEQACSLA